MLPSCQELRPPHSSSALPQVDLHFLTMLTAIATQGAISRETQNGYYVKSYKLEVSTNGEDWMVYRHGKNHKVKPISPPQRHAGVVQEAWDQRSFQLTPQRGGGLVP